MTETVTYLNVWQRPKDDYAEDISDLWERNGTTFPSDVKKQRISEMALLAHAGDALIAVSSLAIVQFLYRGVYLGYYRTFVDANYRRQNVARDITVKTADILEAWSRDNPQSGIMGMMIVVENKGLAVSDLARDPLWTDASRSILVGLTPQGQQRRVRWFDHARFDSLDPL